VCDNFGGLLEAICDGDAQRRAIADMQKGLQMLTFRVHK
jgi:hypothetical protein